jgi:prepilin-type N-terminal cleavage/methylation domain-containing protein
MISTKRKAAPRVGRPAGFTLLEILLAMGLSVILLAIIGQALYMYGQYSTIGRAQVTRSQLARAILKRMETDIRSVVYRPPEEEGGEAAEGQAADEEAAEDADEEVIEPELQDPTDAYATGSLGVVGTADQLVLHISAPSIIPRYWTAKRSTLGPAICSPSRGSWQSAVPTVCPARQPTWLRRRRLTPHPTANRKGCLD